MLSLQPPGCHSHAPPLDFTTAIEKSVEEYRKGIESRALQWLQHEADSSVKLYLLHGRLEPQKDKPTARKMLYLRHYLFMVKTQEHRETLTSIILSTHQKSCGTRIMNYNQYPAMNASAVSA
jgi:hypothetical protein